MEFLHPLLELVCVFWRNVCTFVCSEQTQQCFKFSKTNQVSDIVFSLHAKVHAPKCSGIAAFAPTTDILNNCRGSHDKWAGSTLKPYEITLVDLRLKAD